MQINHDQHERSSQSEDPYLVRNNTLTKAVGLLKSVQSGYYVQIQQTEANFVHEELAPVEVPQEVDAQDAEIIPLNRDNYNQAADDAIDNMRIPA